MTISPADGHLYISDPEKYQVRLHFDFGFFSAIFASEMHWGIVRMAY